MDPPYEEPISAGEEILSKFSALVSRYELHSTVERVAAVYYWNGLAPAFSRPHLAIQSVIEAHTGESKTVASVPAVVRIIRQARYVEVANLWRRSIQAAEQTRRPPSIDWEYQTLQHWNSIITKPASTGEMLEHLLEQYGPHAALIASTLGFTPTQACRSILSVLFTLTDGLSPYLDRDSPFVRRRAGPERQATNLVTPPSAFLELWARLSRIPPPPKDLPATAPLSWAVVQFLTADVRAFNRRGPSFGRWAFLREPDGASRLLIPEMLTETTLSAIHSEMFRRLDKKASGKLGEELGDEFEKRVAQLFTRHWPEIVPKVRVKGPRSDGDTDLLIPFPNGDVAIVQCKARALRSIGRWGGMLTFERDLQQSFHSAVDQASRSIKRLPPKTRLMAVLVILDAYVPGLGVQPAGKGRSFEFPEGFPPSVAMSYYDLRYLTQKLGWQEFPTYMGWRANFLKEGKIRVFDEFDMIRAYLKFRETGSPGIEPGRSGQFIGYDGDDEKAALARIVERVALP